MSNPIRVAQILSNMRGYGVERYVMNLYRFVDRSKVQFDFFVHADSTRIPREEIEALGGRVFLIPPYEHLGQYLKTLKNLFRQNAYPIVQAHISAMNVFPLYAAKRAGVPIRISTCHSSSGKGEGLRRAMKDVLRPFSKVFATHYVAVSRLAGEWLFGKKAVARDRVTFFNPVIDVSAYRYDPQVRREVREELRLGDRFVVGHVGRFNYQKNHDFLLDIFRTVLEEAPESMLMLVGDGELMEAVERKAQALGLREHILMLGNRGDMNRLYQAMDVFVLPSHYEGFPAVALEAQMAGLKVVSSACVTKEAKLRADMAYLELSASPEAWAREILHGKMDARYGSEDFSPYDVSCQAERLERYYMKLLGDAGKGASTGKNKQERHCIGQGKDACP